MSLNPHMPNRGDKVISSHACKDIPPSFEILGTISPGKKKVFSLKSVKSKWTQQINMK